jgi:hypothetical protein
MQGDQATGVPGTLLARIRHPPAARALSAGNLHPNLA